MKEEYKSAILDQVCIGSIINNARASAERLLDHPEEERTMIDPLRILAANLVGKPRLTYEGFINEAKAAVEEAGIELDESELPDLKAQLDPFFIEAAQLQIGLKTGSPTLG